jgi:hypothetical protein
MCFAESGLDTVKVSSTAELASAVAAAPAGRHILVSDGAYTASTLTLSADASLHNPIVIRPLNNPGDVILRNADWVIEGVGLVLDRLYFENAHLTFGNVDGGYKAAAYVRVTRGKFTSVDQTPFRLEAVTSIRIDHNDLSGRGDGVFRLIDMRHTEVIAGTQRGVLIDHNYIHDMAPTTGGNGSELIGTSSGDAGPYDPELSILYNLFDTITIPGEGEVFSAKLRGAHVEGNTFDGVALYLTAARQGASWEVRSNWWENSGTGGNGPLIGHGEDHLFIGNHIEGTINEIEIHGGDYLGSVGSYCQSCGYAACENCRVVGNDIEGDLEIGTHFGGNMNSQAATGTNNYGNKINGKVVLDNEIGTTTKTEKTAYTAAVKLTPGSVGLLAADPLCD